MNLFRFQLRIVFNYFNNINRINVKTCQFCRSSHFTCKKTNIFEKVCLSKKFYSSKKKTDIILNETRKRPKIIDDNVREGLSKYKIFKDFDSPVILDVDEERQLRLEHPELFEEPEQTEEFDEIIAERGITGVFDIEELVDVLRKDNAKNIVTIKIPPEYKYVDYMVIVTGRSSKHLYAMAEFVKKCFKRRKHDCDRIPKIEGSTSALGKYSDWLAMDLGNIVLHLFLEQTRVKYDLESLWSIGAEFDNLSNEKENQYITLLQQHTHSSLEDLIPLEESFSENKKDLA